MNRREFICKTARIGVGTVGLAIKVQKSAGRALQQVLAHEQTPLDEAVQTVIKDLYGLIPDNSQEGFFHTYDNTLSSLNLDTDGDNINDKVLNMVLDIDNIKFRSFVLDKNGLVIAAQKDKNCNGKPDSQSVVEYDKHGRIKRISDFSGGLDPNYVFRMNDLTGDEKPELVTRFDYEEDRVNAVIEAGEAFLVPHLTLDRSLGRITFSRYYAFKGEWDDRSYVISVRPDGQLATLEEHHEKEGLYERREKKFDGTSNIQEDFLVSISEEDPTHITKWESGKKVSSLGGDGFGEIWIRDEQGNTIRYMKGYNMNKPESERGPVAKEANIEYDDRDVPLLFRSTDMGNYKISLVNNALKVVEGRR